MKQAIKDKFQELGVSLDGFKIETLDKTTRDGICHVTLVSKWWTPEEEKEFNKETDTLISIIKPKEEYIVFDFEQIGKVQIARLSPIQKQEILFTGSLSEEIPKESS